MYQSHVSFVSEDYACKVVVILVVPCSVWKSCEVVRLNRVWTGLNFSLVPSLSHQLYQSINSTRSNPREQRPNHTCVFVLLRSFYLYRRSRPLSLSHPFSPNCVLRAIKMFYSHESKPIAINPQSRQSADFLQS